MDDHHPRLMQTVILQILNGEVLVTDLKFMVERRYAHVWLLPPVCSTLRFFGVFILNPFQHAANQTEVSLATDQRPVTRRRKVRSARSTEFRG